MNKILIYSLLFVLPVSVFAAKIDLSLDKSSTKEGTVVEVRINSEGKNINVVEGTLLFKSNDDVRRLYVNPDTTGSIMTLWPTPPQYNEENRTLHFVGGVPNGFIGDEILFKINISSKVSGSVEVSLVDVTAYLNDGKGTLETVEKNSVGFQSKSTAGDNSNVFMRNILLAGVIIILISLFIFVLFKYGNKKNI